MKKTKLLTMPFMASIAVAPMLTACAPMIAQNINDEIVNEVSEDPSEYGACSIVYVGKDVSTTGLPIIARSCDYSPRSMNLRMKVHSRDSWANKEVTSYDGYKYKMPSHTYRYVSAPITAKSTKPGKGALWEINGLNENGVGISCTLTAATNKEALAVDPYVKTGVGEATYTQSIIPQAKSAKHAVQVAGSIIDEHGAFDADVIMVVDQKEAWVLEILTGHQYIGIKLPTDKAFTLGNEFFLDTLASAGITSEEDFVASPNLLKLAQDNGFAEFDDSGIKDIYHLDLFKTYAKPLVGTDEEGKPYDTDSSHMRTWRGHSLFAAPTLDDQRIPDYVKDEKYEAFVTPYRKLSPHDVIQCYRDQFDDIAADKSERFQIVKGRINDGTIRPIAVETALNVHIISSDPKLPSELAVTNWTAPSNGNYSPFILLNNGVNYIDGEYGQDVDRYGLHENLAASIYRKLNSLCVIDRTNYGYPVQDYWRVFEEIVDEETNQVINDAAKRSLNEARDIITNFSSKIRRMIVDAAKDVTNDLLLHMAEDAVGKRTLFDPQVNIKELVYNLGWKNFKRNGDIVTFDNGTDKCTIDLTDGTYGALGTIKINDNEPIELKTSLTDDGKAMASMRSLVEQIYDYSDIIKINIDDFKSELPGWAWATITLGILAIAGIAVAIYLVISKKKKVIPHM